MTLDEAIQHCEEVAETNERICDTEPSIGLPDIYKHKDEAKKCASEHRQLAEWLKELKAYRKQDSVAISNLSMSHILNHEVKWINERMTREDNPNICDDVVSREAMMDIVKRWYPYKAEIEQLKALPSVTPQQRTGRWIDSHIPESILCECSECGFTCGAYSFKYCPMCGCKMEVMP